MGRRNIAVAAATVAAINTQLSLLDGLTQKLSVVGNLPDSAIIYATESANTFLGGPDGSKATKGAPAWRALVAADVPNLDASKITTGKLGLARGGTNADLSGSGGANQFVKQSSAGGALTVSAIGSGDVPDGALSSNVALLNRNAQVFSGNYNQFVQVGVGMVPSNAFDVTGLMRSYGSTLAELILEHTTANKTSAIGFRESGVDKFIVGTGIYRADTKFDIGSNAASFVTIDTSGNVGVGVVPDASSALRVDSTTGAILIPRMTTTQKNALTAINGMIVYDSTLNKFQGYENGAWANFSLL